MKRCLLAAVLGALLAATAARAETARDLLDRAKKVNDAREPRDVSQRMVMRIFDSRGGERTRDLAVYRRNYGHRTRKTVTFFLSPPEVKGVGFLSWSYPDKDDDQWLYLPELNRVRQIAGSSRKQSFQGSDFAYEDLEIVFDDLRDWTEEEAPSRLLRDGEAVGDVACAVIELGLQGKDYAYSRLVVWLDRQDETFRRIELYDKRDGLLLKSLLLGPFETIDGIPTARRLEMANVKKETKTTLEISEVRYNRGLADEAFTERALERGRVD
jgi:outer membrane lipoprotein-sorting protein